ncbi:HD domain-containing protein [uncultured Jatrophihabitans sp.]|uniref:HD domain-containing protein n=1 Tax=uncultured Jatrophihabitans sp. TaxID=1610747 RepID=UPI0035C9AC22
METAWVAAVATAGGRVGPAADSADDLVRHYAEPHRRYHTATHVIAVLRDSAELADALGLDDVQRAVIALAACAHDVVYNARPGDDERASAQWAREALRMAGLAAAHVERVAQLVLTTLTHHTDPDDVPATALLDADLAILASAPDTYAAYVSAVRAEYAAVDDDGWRTGRAAVLSGLLDRPRLYLSEPGRMRWEAAARANVAAELGQLTGTS